MYDTTYHQQENIYSRSSFTINHPRALNISRRIERAVAMNVTDRWASQPYQITSYGLGKYV